MWHELLTILLILAVVIGFIKTFFAYLLTHPLRSRSRVDYTPIKFGLPYEKCEIKTIDNIVVRGWLIPHSKSSPTIVLLHPYRENKGTLLPLARDLYINGYNVLLIDFRGHGESGGKAVSFGVKEVNDIASAIEYVRKKGFDTSRIGLVGVSMGAVAAIFYTAQKGGVKAVVADSGFKTLTSVISNITRLPKIFYIGAFYLACLFAGIALSDNDPIQYVDKVSPAALLIIHCKGDPLVNVSDAYALYERAREPKELWLIDEIIHTGLYAQKGEDYRRRIIDFLDRCFRERVSTCHRREFTKL